MNILKDSESNAISGLGTSQHTCVYSQLYKVECKSTIVPTSGLSIVINQNGSPIATSKAPTANDIYAFVSAAIEATAGDIITVVLSSSLIQDSVNLNNVKSIITIDRV